MNKIDSKNKKFMIFGIIILVIAVVSSTLAYYIWSSGEQIKISTTVGGAYVYFDGGSAIENATLRPVADKSKGITKNISMRADATGVTANVYLDLVTLPDSLKDVSFRYAIYNGSTLAKEGNFSSTSLSSSTSTCTANSTTHITLLSNVSVPTTKRTYTLYIWIDGANYTNPKSMMNQTFSFKLHADGTGAILNNEYELTNSDGNTYTPTYNGSGTKTIRSSAPLSKFKEVKVDNAVVDSSNYTLTEGSTIVTFKEAYLQSLSVGDHTFKIISTDGIASGKITIKKTVTAAQMITNLYNNSDKTAVTNNSITYNYATSVNLMNDRKGSMSTGIDSGNIRYYGANPNNYIYFNCSDYNNQSSSTCELWRIIGVFDGKVKLMRNDSIGTMEYDNDKEDTYLVGLSNNDNIQKTNDLLYIIDTESKRMTSIKNVPGKVDTDDSGTNDYSVSSLQKILNNYYYNSKNYSGNSSYTFTNIGIKNDVTRNIISSNNYYLGGIQYGLNYYANEIYQSERSSEVYDGNATTWTGKIAIPYPSDYGYAVDLNKCSESLVLYNDTACISNSWISSMFTSDTWLLNPRADTSNQSSSISSNKVLPTVGVDSKYAVFPTLYLNSELSIKSGTGSSSDPYQLNV
ncbi:MAG: hypothetical protein UCL21_03885 [Bacilli bacterium]|nr:hypothetical protein [Bacilli bacterium]